MALNDAVPSSATDVFKRNAEDADRLLNATGNITTRTGKILPSWDEITQSHAAWNNRGAWATATAYAVNDIWEDGGVWYVVLSAYTSGASAAADIAGPNIAVLNGNFGSAATKDAGTAFDQIPLNADIVYPVDSVQNIAGLVGTQEDQQISIKGWHPNSDLGGGILYWDSAKPKSEHNGGTVFSPTVPFSATTGDYLNGVGETDGGGSGCWIRNNSKSVVFSNQFGLKGDDSDETNEVQFFRDYLAANTSTKLVFNEGIYRYTTSPNWAIDKTCVEFDGDVTFHKIGAGTGLIFDAGATTSLSFDFSFGWNNRVNVIGDTSSYGGVFVRSCHHCKIAATVRGCGPTFDAFTVQFSVLGEYRFITSVNQAPFAADTKPLRGISLTRRDVGEDTSACIFYNPIIEGVDSDGIVLDHALKNLFINGTSEGNGGENVVCTANADNNTFQGIDSEVSGGTVGIRDGGRRNRWVNILDDNQFVIDTTAVKCVVEGGVFNAFTNKGKGSNITDVSYASNSGVFSDTGTFTTLRDAYRLVSATFTPENKVLGRSDYTKTISVGVFAVTPTVPGLVTKSAIPLEGVKVGDNITLISENAVATGFIPTPSASCTTDGQINITYTQVTGSAVSPLPSGSDFVVSVNGAQL